MDWSANNDLQEWYRVGDLTIDARRQVVSRSGAEISLPRLSFDLLLALARAYPRMLTIDELMDRVWAPSLVNPETVSQRVKLLRQSLDDDPRNPRYIVGVRGRGYRIDAAVIRESEEPATQPEPEARPVAEPARPLPPAMVDAVRRPGSKARWGVLLALAAMAVASLTYLAMHRFGLPIKVSTQGLATKPAASSDPTLSVAVLPFLDISERGNQAYFADGVTEEIINRLAQEKNLRVAARTSSFYFKDKPATVQEIAKTLGVARVLEGSVRKSGDTLRITVQLIRADTGYHLWSSTYERKVADPFGIQDEIAGAVVRVLQAPPTEIIERQRPSTVAPEAHNLYLQGLAHWNRGLPADNKLAADYLRRAIALDPNFAMAWALLSQISSDQVIIGTASYETVRREAQDQAKKAIELGPNLADSHLAMASVKRVVEWDLNAEAAELERALDIEPSNAPTLRTAVEMRVCLGQYAEAERLALRAVAVDPVNSWSYYQFAVVKLYEGAFAEAEHAYRRAIELDPDTPFAHADLAVLLVNTGRAREALAELDRDGVPEEREAIRPLALQALGETNAANRELAAVEKKYSATLAYGIAAVYAGRGALDLAFTWLDRAYRNHEDAMLYLRGDPLFKNAHSDPRFSALLRRIKLPE